jgi:hypothetical protein
MKKSTFPLEISHLDSDVRLEVISNELIESGINLDQILVSPQGEFFRGFQRDISALQLVEDTLGNPVFYQINTSRNGVYDGLPPNIFHDNLDDILAGKEIDPIENVKRNREEEEAARRFFQIVEKEMYRLLISFEQEERKTIIGTLQFNQHEIFLKLWYELSGLDSRYIIPLMQILPLVNHYQGNLSRMESFLEILLKKQVRIWPMDQIIAIENTGYDSVLGQCLLGFDSFSGGVFYDFDPVFTIEIGPMTGEDLEDFMQGEPAAKALDVFCQYYFPLQSKILWKFSMLETKGTVVLTSQKYSANTNQPESRLGISAFL